MSTTSAIAHIPNPVCKHKNLSNLVNLSSLLSSASSPPSKNIVRRGKSLHRHHHMDQIQNRISDLKDTSMTDRLAGLSERGSRKGTTDIKGIANMTSRLLVVYAQIETASAGSSLAPSSPTKGVLREDW
jgi:hypothetical protein